VCKVSLDLPAHRDNEEFPDFLVHQVALDRREIADSQGQRETVDKSDRQALQALLDLRDGLDRRETRVERDSPATLEPLVRQDCLVSVVHRGSRVLLVQRVGREILVQLVILAGLEVLELLDLEDRKAPKDSREPLDPAELLDCLEDQVSAFIVYHLLLH